MIHLVTRSRTKIPAAKPYAFQRTLPMHHLFHSIGTTHADGGERCARAHISGVLPAALALGSGSAFHAHREVLAWLASIQGYLGNDEQRRQVASVLLEQRIYIAIGGEVHPGFQRRSDELVLARRLE